VVKKSNYKNKLTLERDSEGVVLPTLRNKKAVNDLLKECGSTEKLKEVMGKDYLQYITSCIFDPRHENVFYGAVESAIKANAKSHLLDKLDQADG